MYSNTDFERLFVRYKLVR